MEYTHKCGGTILTGGVGELRHHYCDRCGAFAYGDEPIPSGSDRAANQHAWDAAADCSPEAPQGRTSARRIDARLSPNP